VQLDRGVDADQARRAHPDGQRQRHFQQDMQGEGGGPARLTQPRGPSTAATTRIPAAIGGASRAAQPGPAHLMAPQRQWSQQWSHAGE